jgi:hypothetical protein
MGLVEQNELHSRAVQWYYDFAVQGGPGVPESILRHVRRCLVCHKQIDRLKEAVTGAGGETDTSRSNMKRDVVDSLSEHFHCLDERVTCSRVKPFLPGLLMPSLQIRIPTPITVHVDHCPECADDLAALRDLALSPEQLERLERLFERKPPDSSRLCRRARSKIAGFVRGSLDGIDGELLDHLCTCERCRLRVHRSRQELLEKGANGETQAAGCDDDVPTAQLFDYAVPYGRTTDVAGKSQGSPPRAGAPHDPVQAGRLCLKRIQELDETIYGIAERTDSGIATVYSTIEEAKNLSGSFADPYPEYPIDVQVIHGEPEQAATSFRPRVDLKAALKGSTCNPRVRLILKAALAAAAMIPLAILFLNTATASGITLAQVLEALGRADNVHITRFYPDTGEVLQELRMSREMNVVVTIEGRGHTVYNLGAMEKKSISSDRGLVDAVKLSEAECAAVREWMNRILGFTSADVPVGATWREMSQDAAKGLAVYELSWTGQTLKGRDSFCKSELTLDVATKLPLDIRNFQSTPDEEQWQLVSVQEFQYLRRDQMAAEISDYLDPK